MNENKLHVQNLISELHFKRFQIILFYIIYIWKLIILTYLIYCALNKQNFDSNLGELDLDNTLDW